LHSATVTNKIGLKGVLGLFSSIIALVAVITLLIPETRGSKLGKDIENETLFIGEAMSSQASSTKGRPEIVELEMGKERSGSEVVQGRFWGSYINRNKSMRPVEPD
jgi:hypothetical protein